MIAVSLPQLLTAWLLAIAFCLLWGQLCTWRERARWEGPIAAEAIGRFAFWSGLPTADESWERLSEAVAREDMAVVVPREFVEVVPVRIGGVH